SDSSVLACRPALRPLQSKIVGAPPWHAAAPSILSDWATVVTVNDRLRGSAGTAPSVTGVSSSPSGPPLRLPVASSLAWPLTLLQKPIVLPRWPRNGVGVGVGVREGVEVDVAVLVAVRVGVLVAVGVGVAVPVGVGVGVPVGVGVAVPVGVGVAVPV